ncbi:polypeptide N-acetylgalactosaminyltransferase 17 [Syngnathus acus]|uniref:polypeptide N-acetylgalactosaminyltransferase 17 n=1 Tax=Syngnathus acus TaxID=161584 RepID=UPI0018861BE2|nr:polypeptide N-acetylgalactosaminyltransferase 17 [Syngnathus acus]XP_037124184.1 polypeptide N-acetylgalactosaminyltransferase 17 [Syngnathus acus]
MAILRRWRFLLVLNVLALAGIMTLWSRCSSARKPVVRVATPDAPDAERTRASRANGTASHQVLLDRLSSLEDVVYRQLNGLSKSLGLIEGFGGRRAGDLAATLSPNEESESKNLREKYGYNAYLSNTISLDRTIPDYRPDRCQNVSHPQDLPQMALVFIFVNEALSVILRSVHSAVNHTPAHLLKEIILVDDHSDDEELKGPLEDYMKKRYPGLVKIVRNHKREGLIRARIEGWKAATAEVTGFFDAHVEFTPFWAEPVLTRIKEDRRRIILPSIDNIKKDTFEVERYLNSAHGFNWELWCMYISPPKQWWDDGDLTAPIRSPAMIGCSFVVNRLFFGEIGLLDPGMDVYGGENIELGIRVWMCGGSMEVLPCSRVAHIARMKKPYISDIAFYTRRNALRVAEVWMDHFKSNVYVAWNIPMENHGIDFGDISERVALRKSLQCKNFQWYLENIYPEMRTYSDTLYYGELRNSKASHLCLDDGMNENDTATLYPCHGLDPQEGRYTKDGHLFLGSLGKTGVSTRCVADDPASAFPQLIDCEKDKNKHRTKWIFTQGDSIVNSASGRCLEVVPTKLNFGHQVVLKSCSGQRWTIKNTMKDGAEVRLAGPL